MNNKLVLYGNKNGVINLGNVTEVRVNKDTAFESEIYHIRKIGINGWEYDGDPYCDPYL